MYELKKDQKINLLKKGQIYMVLLDGCRGSEVAKLRPCIVCQNDIGNKYAPTTIVIPISHRNGRNQPTQVEIFKNMLKEGFAVITGIALAEQIRTVDKSRIRDLVGELTTEGMAKIDKAILISMGITV